jgi:hypothetical protein
MTWFSFFVRIPAFAVATPAAVVAAILIAAVYGYRLEIDAIGLRFDKNSATVESHIPGR